MISLFLSLLITLSGEKINEFLKEATLKGYGEWAEFLLESMPEVDIVNLEPDDFIEYFDALSLNLSRVPWKDKITDYLFYHYILPHRVSQEPLERFTQIYKDTLYELVKDSKGMKEAVLRVNEWCFTKIKYKPTERWDQNAMTTIKRGFGRCEEMAILFIKALRTVCIPAREVYTPRWPFTESNHAWVEVWIDGKWYFLGAAEPGDLNWTWFRNSVKRTAVVLGVVYGEVSGEREIVYKRGKDYTIINSLPTYAEPLELTVKVMNNDKPVSNAIVSLSVYNYAAPSPVLKDTARDGEAKFVVGKTDFFIYAKRDTLKGFMIYHPADIERDTVILNIGRNDIPDTSFWLYVKRVEEVEGEPEYRPNMDSLKSVQEENLKKLEDISIDERDSILIEILKGARGNWMDLYSFYKNLSRDDKILFKRVFKGENPKDLVGMDTTGLGDELNFLKESIKLSEKFGVSDSLLDDYVLRERILYEEYGFYRKPIFESLGDLLGDGIEETVKGVLSWTLENVRESQKENFFGPMMNPHDVLRAKKGREIEIYVFITGVLRTFGIPARVKWNRKGVEYWNRGWREISLNEEEEEIKEPAYLVIEFFKEGENVTDDMEYYRDYSIIKFEEKPVRLDPDIEKVEKSVVVRLEKDVYYLVTGFRNAFGDAYVRLKRIDLSERDTLYLRVDVSIPYENLRPGDLILRKYKGLEGIENFGLGDKDLKRGDVLIIVFDVKGEASKSTLMKAKDKINNFKGRVYLFCDTENLELARKFIKELGIQRGSLYLIGKDVYEKKWGVKELPSVLHLRDGKPIFWVEGLLLHLSSLLEL
jgi:hypothetical protein